jgi:hypothetical protein
MKRSILGAVAVAVVVSPVTTAAQDRPVRWQRRGQHTEIPVTVFHSTQSANLPTAETLAAGEWLFEISHRFGLIDSGTGGFYGLDGPVINRFGLAFAPTDRILVGVLRSNLFDNVDVGVKARLFEASGALPLMIGVAGGIAWNTQAPEGDPGFTDNETQAYAQVMLNALLGGRLAVGVVPSWVRNPNPFSTDANNAFAVGLHGQAYLSEMVSVFGEWVVSEEQPGLGHDTGSFGIELETGGHFFKLLLSNSQRMNPSQVLAGTGSAVATDQLRFGFNITRILTF